MNHRPPGILWVSIIGLGVISFVQLIAGLGGGGRTLVSVALNVALLIGLYRGHRWAYVAVIVFSVLGVVMTLANRPAAAVATLLINAVIVVPMLLAHSYFWKGRDSVEPDRAEPVDALRCPTCGYSLMGLTEPRCPECGQRFKMPV